jgi:hypothetical protein
VIYLDPPARPRKTCAAASMNMSGCDQITDAGLAHLTGIHTLDVSGCDEITDAGLAHLTGIHTWT